VMDRLSRCERCGAQAEFIGFAPDDARRCFECDAGMCLPLGTRWWAQAAGRMRTACRPRSGPRLGAQGRMGGDVRQCPVACPAAALPMAERGVADNE
jgi:hypothetical protein